jgi:vacuolar-type H+-ATPase subunit I/STV1
MKVSPIKDLNNKATRFSDPPAPPPQQPLPEKPDVANALRRADTERPKAASPVRPDAQMSSLTDALNSAKKEIETQSVRLRDLENLLNEERRAREDAEERANRLERESIKEPEDDTADQGAEEPEATESKQEEATGLQDRAASPTPDDTTARLQQRLESMMAEMNEMKQQMEAYRERAEAAESDRKSLAEMVESIRKENASLASKASSRHRQSNGEATKDAASTGTDGHEESETEEGEITIVKHRDIDEGGPSPAATKDSAQNGHPIESGDGTQIVKAAHALAARSNNRTDLMYHGGPVGAIVTVVAIGVAVMAMLNQYPKAER